MKDWIVIRDGTGGEDAYSMKCLRCGAKQRFDPPISITYLCRVAKAFERENGRCVPANTESEVSDETSRGNRTTGR